MIGKMLNLGGIDNRPPKANQSMGRFRVARNVMPTPDGRLIPRYDWEIDAGQNAKNKSVHHITQYNGQPLSVVSQDIDSLGSGNEDYRFYKGVVPIPYSPAISPYQSRSTEINHSPLSYRRNNTTYFLLPSYGAVQATLAKYDGVQMWNAGCPQPIISTAALRGSSWMRVVQHMIDFDNNEPASELVEFSFAPAASITVNVSNSGTNLISAGETESPKAVITPSSNNSLFFRGTSAYNAGTQDYTITVTNTNITRSSMIGSYVMVDWTRFGTNLNSAGVDGFGLAMKVKSLSPLKLDATGAKYLNLNREWTTIAGGIALLGAGITLGTQMFMSFWRSASQTGVYYYASFSPSFPASTGTAFNVLVDTSPLTSAEVGATNNIIRLGPILNDIYDVTTRKLSPNSIYPWGLDYNLYGMTTYQDLLLLASDDLIWYSDPTLSGSFEQLNTSSFIRVGDTEYGRITSICGTQDFLVVCRERKNYYVTGNLVTGNYRVQEIIEAEVGAWSNNAAINIKDSVVFLTALGVYQVSSGGKAFSLSDKLPKNFATYDANSVNEDVSFRMTGFVSDITNVSHDGISVAYDEFRELLAFMKKGTTNAEALIFHAKTGEFYEWDGLMANYATIRANCIAFINSEYYLGQVQTAAATWAAEYCNENNTLLPSYFPTNPVKLYTTWMTGGEPSLEKQLLQLKFFGRIKTTLTKSIKICHYKDWDYSTKITNSIYQPINLAGSLNSQTQYSHKKRLDSDKVLSVSVGIELTEIDTSFEIESLEVEFQPIQGGMKK